MATSKKFEDILSEKRKKDDHSIKYIEDKLKNSGEGFKIMKSSTKDKAEGKMDKAKGKIKEGAGKAVDDKDLEAKGKVDKAAGKAKDKKGDVKKVVDQ